MKDLLTKASQKRADNEQNIRPKRKAAKESRKNPVVEDSEIDDSDTDAHYKPMDQKSSSSEESILTENESEPTKPTKSSSKSFYKNLEKFRTIS